MANEIITKDITLGYAATAEGEYKILENLAEIPEIGDTPQEKIEVTNLSDGTKRYIAGLKDSAGEFAFKFWYSKDQFEELIALTGTKYWKVSMPDGINATFSGTPSVRFDAASPNNAISYTLTVIVESEVKFNSAA